MKNGGYSDAQIMAVLKQAEGGVPVSELCREHGMSSASFYKWRVTFGGMDASLISESQLLSAIGPRTMDLRVKAVSEARTSRDIAAQYPAGQWMAMTAVARLGVSSAQACRAFEISETCYRYSPVMSDENEEIADWLERLTTA
jgi:putative transposase